MDCFVCDAHRPLLTLSVSWIQCESNLPLLEESEADTGILQHVIFPKIQYNILCVCVCVLIHINQIA